MTRLIVVTGIPASGKTTVAAALAQRSARGVVIDGDTIRAMVVSGYVNMSREPSAEALRQLRLRYQASLAVTGVYLQQASMLSSTTTSSGRCLTNCPVWCRATGSTSSC